MVKTQDMRWREPMISPIVGFSWQVSIPAWDCDCAEAGAGVAAARARAKRAIAERVMFSPLFVAQKRFSVRC
jgi:hypothetical protein